MSINTPQLAAGARVKVIQQIPRLTGVTTSTTCGKVVRLEQGKTGSWFAHAKDDKLWLDRLIIEKDNGEIAAINLDQYTHIEVLDQ